jgi:hypothetical protein
MSSEKKVESWIAKVNRNVKNLEDYYNDIKNENLLLELTEQIGDIKILFEEDMKRIEEEIKEGKEVKKEGAFLKIKESCLSPDKENTEATCEKLRKRFIKLYNQISQYKIREEKVKSKTKKINEFDKYVNKFIEKMKSKDENEFKQLSLILKKEITSGNIDKYKDVIKNHFKSLEPNHEEYPNYIRIIWIINGFLNDNNRMIEDWFSDIKSLFEEYDILPNKQINFNESGGSGGLNEIENIIDDDFYEIYKNKRTLELKEERKQNNKEIEEEKKKELKFGEINLNAYKKYNEIVNEDLPNEYLNRGMEINDVLRNGTMGEKLRINKRFETAFITIKKILPNVDYIKVCRMMSKRYSDDIRGGFISTSNYCLLGFGIEYHYIYVPFDVKIMLIDLTDRKLNKDLIEYIGNKEKTVYEIVIHPSYEMIHIKDNNYVINSDIYKNNKYSFDNLINPIY